VAGSLAAAEAPPKHAAPSSISSSAPLGEQLSWTSAAAGHAAELPVHNALQHQQLVVGGSGSNGGRAAAAAGEGLQRAAAGSGSSGALVAAA
jgi:hypothetical protein